MTQSYVQLVFKGLTPEARHGRVAPGQHEAGNAELGEFGGEGEVADHGPIAAGRRPTRRVGHRALALRSRLRRPRPPHRRLRVPRHQREEFFVF